MKRLRSARLALIPVVAIAVAVAAQGATARSSAGGTLVIDRSFEIKTADPQRAFEPTASIVNRAVFDTLLTYKGADVAHPDNNAIPIGVSLGTWNGVACAIVIANDNVTPVNADDPTKGKLSGRATAAGNLCVRVYDVGFVPGSSNYELLIDHY